MKVSTLELIRAVLRADETVDMERRAKILAILRSPTLRPDGANQPRLVNSREACERLGGICYQTLWRYGRTGKLRIVRLSHRKIGVPEEDIVAIVNSKEDAPCK